MPINPTNSATSSSSSLVGRETESQRARFEGRVGQRDNHVYRAKPLFRLKSLAEGSDLFSLDGDHFGAVSDTQDKLVVFSDAGEIEQTIDLRGLQNGSSLLEAAAFDPSTNRLAVVREEVNEILIYPKFDPADPTTSRPKRMVLPPFAGGGHTNKGVEGMTFLTAQQSPTGDPQLLLANEAIPRKLYLLEVDGEEGKTLKLTAEVKIDDDIRDYCKDFSALTVDPKTNTVFISSDESETVVQLRLEERPHKRGEPRKYAAKYVDHYTVAGLKRIEGIAFDAQGNLLLMTENKSKLYMLTRR